VASTGTNGREKGGQCGTVVIAASHDDDDDDEKPQRDETLV